MEVGLSSTATIMFGHVDSPPHPGSITGSESFDLQEANAWDLPKWCRLPFVSEGAPIYRRGESRPGPTWRESAARCMPCTPADGGAADSQCAGFLGEA